jgi:hypothetical protein
MHRSHAHHRPHASTPQLALAAACTAFLAILFQVLYHESIGFVELGAVHRSRLVRVVPVPSFRQRRRGIGGALLLQQCLKLGQVQLTLPNASHPPDQLRVGGT